MKAKEIVLIGDSADIPQDLKQALIDHNVKIVAETDLVDHTEYLNSFKVVPKMVMEAPYSGPPRNRHERRKAKSKRLN